MEILSVLRILNIVLAAFVIVSMAVRLRGDWRQIAPDLRLLGLVIVGFCVWGIWGSAESIMTHVPPASRTIVGSIVLFWATIACLIPDKHREFRKSDRQPR